MKVWKTVCIVLVMVVIASIGTACGEKKFNTQLASKLQAVLDDTVASPDTIFPGAFMRVSSPELGT